MVNHVKYVCMGTCALCTHPCVHVWCLMRQFWSQWVLKPGAVWFLHGEATAGLSLRGSFLCLGTLSVALTPIHFLLPGKFSPVQPRSLCSQLFWVENPLLNRCGAVGPGLSS